MMNRRHFLLVAVTVPALLASAVPAAHAARPYPIARVPGGNFPDQISTDVDAAGGRILLASGLDGSSTVLVRSTGQRIDLVGRPMALSGDGRVALSIDDEGIVRRQVVGTSKAKAHPDAVPDINWFGSSVDSDRTGRFVAVTASNGVLARTGVFLADLQNGTSIDVTKSVGSGAQAFHGTISGDGRYVAFSATAVIGGSTQVYVYDRVTKKTELVTQKRSGGKSAGSASAHQISADGRSVVFSSTAGDLVTGTSAGTNRLYRRNLDSDKTVLVSSTVDTTSTPTISADGRRIAYVAQAKIAIPGIGTTFDTGLFLWTAGTNRRVDMDKDDKLPNAGVRRLSLSEDGRVLVFTSTATDLTGAGRSGVFIARLPAI